MFGNNLKYYRLKKQLTKKQLASLCNLSPMAITNYENNKRMPSLSIIEKLAKNLDVSTVDFISYQDKHLKFHHSQFRKNSKVTKTTQEYIKSSIEEYFYRFFNAVECAGGQPLPQPIKVHQLTKSNNFENDAIKLREFLNFSTVGPINNLINYLEKIGILIVQLRLDTDTFFGINGMVNNYPYIAINENMNYERQRSTIAHELAHMMFNSGIHTNNKDEEKFADAISGAFLITKDDIYREIGLKRSAITKDMIITSKEYGISLMLLVTRAKQAGVISSSTAKQFYIKAGKMGWRKNEPFSTGRHESSSLFKLLIYRAVNNGNINIQKASELLNTPSTDIEKNIQNITENIEYSVCSI